MQLRTHGTGQYARFLLAWRAEVTDDPTQQRLGRGWVVRVPDAAEPALCERPQPRWFDALADLPRLLVTLLDDAPPAAPQDRSGSR